MVRESVCTYKILKNPQDLISSAYVFDTVRHSLQKWTVLLAVKLRLNNISII